MINIASYIGVHALSLNNQYELDDGGIQTETYYDHLGNLTGPGGILRNPDGTPFEEGKEWSPSEAWRAYALKMKDRAKAVSRLLVRPASVNEHGAMTLLAWNVGIGAFEGSTVLREHNLGNREAAAAGFHLWRYGTVRPGIHPKTKKPLIGPDDNILEYRWLQGSRGVFRRNCATGLLYLDLKWDDATHPSRIHLEVKETVFEPHKARWKDIIDEETLTPWREIRRRAEGQLLDSEAIEAVPEPEPQPEPVIVPRGYEEPEAPVPPRRPPQPYRDYDPKAPEKDIAFSKRVWGFVLLVWGWFQTGILMVAELPIVSELASMSPLSVGDWRIGLLIIMAGLLLMWVGKVTAKGPLK